MPTYSVQMWHALERLDSVKHAFDLVPRPPLIHRGARATSAGVHTLHAILTRVVHTHLLGTDVARSRAFRDRLSSSPALP